MADPDKVHLSKTDKFSSLVNSQLTSMRQGNTLTNFVITVQGEEEKTYCHKVVLAIHSPYFLAMFTSDVGEATKDSVHYKHISLDIAKLVVDYMYYEEIEFDTDQLMDIIQACDYMQIKVLKQRCINEVRAAIKPSNVLAWLKFSAEESVKKSGIKSWCLESIRTNFAEISQQEEILLLTYAELHECVTEVKKSNVNRDIILCAVFKWTSDDTASRIEHLKELIPLVQLENCSLHAIIDVMDTYKSIIGPNAEVLGMLTKSMKQMTTSQADKPEASATLTQKTLVLIGGNDNHKVNLECWSLVPTANKFSKLCTIPFNDLGRYHSVCQIPEGFAITGGSDSTLFAVFSASTRSWRKLQNLLQQRRQHASICIQGTLYAIGGVQGNSTGASVECFTLEGGQWEDGPNLPVAVGWPIATELNNSAYVIDLESRKLLQLDVAKKTWTPRAALSCGNCITFSMAAVNGRLCAAGGNPRITAWYTPETNTWCMGKQQPKENHKDGCLIQHDSTTLLLLGGNANTIGTDVIEELNMTDGSWSTKAYKMPAKLYDHKAFMLNLPQE